MATKKQKRAAALEKREQFLSEVKESGLAAQRLDHDHRAKQMQLMKEEADRINRRWNRILLEGMGSDVR